MKKRVLSVILALVLLVVCVPFGAITVSAYGTSPSDAVELVNKEWEYRYWTNSNYNSAYYNEIVLPSRGYITFSVEKPIDSDGEVSGYDLTLYDSAGNIVWQGDKSGNKDIFNEYYDYKIGLNKGTYYMNIDPEFYVPRNSSIPMQYRYVFTKSSTCEVENNENAPNATAMSVNTTYTGFMSEGTSDDDYYKVKLTAWTKYKISVKNINPKEVSCYLRDASDDSICFGSRYVNGTETETTNSVVWTYTPNVSGYYFIYLWDCPDKDLEYTVRVDAPKTPVSKLKVSLSSTSYVYNGKVKQPSVVVKTASGKTISSKNYTVTYASGRKNVGKYKVTVKMKGNYSGTKTLYFTIKPVKTTIAKITPAKATMKVYVSRKTTQVTGYQIQYSTNKKFTNAKTKNITSYKTGSASITGLKKNTTYYVRVRTYKVVSGTKYYSSWSTVSTKKTKK